MNSVQSIYDDMVAIFVQETGMAIHPGSDMAVRLYAFASALFGLYAQNQWTLDQAFPQTAKGDYLDKHATLRGLTRKGARKAGGVLRFSLDSAQDQALTIPVASTAMTAGLVRFETTQVASIPAGGLFVDVPASACEFGVGGNVPAGSVRTMVVAPVGIASCSNPVAFVGGEETEDDEGLRARILDSFRRMPNGANAAYYEREARTIPSVVAVNVIGRARGRGTVDVVIAGATGDPGTQTVEAVQAHLQTQREIAVDVLTRAPTSRTFDVDLSLSLRQGADPAVVKAAVSARISAYFDGSRLGESVFRAKLGQLIFDVDGVENYHITAPATDLILQPGELPVLQNLSVEVAS